MPTRKIEDFQEEDTPCWHPEHNPPSHMVFPPGKCVHVCPGCGHKITFTVPRIFCGAPRHGR